MLMFHLQIFFQAKLAWWTYISVFFFSGGAVNCTLDCEYKCLDLRNGEGPECVCPFGYTIFQNQTCMGKYVTSAFRDFDSCVQKDAVHWTILRYHKSWLYALFWPIARMSFVRHNFGDRYQSHITLGGKANQKMKDSHSVVFVFLHFLSRYTWYNR